MQLQILDLIKKGKEYFYQASKKKKTLIIIFIIGFIYVTLPTSESINQFPGLPGSAKSDYEGDTTQNPNIAAYFTDFKRAEMTTFYKNDFSKKLLFGIPLPVISLNHPPETAYKYIRDQQESTFIEEYIFPLRESIFVNGYEPSVENDMFKKRDRSFVGDHLFFQNTFYNSKVTLRFYPSPVVARVSTYLGIWLASWWLYKLFKQVQKEYI